MFAPSALAMFALTSVMSAASKSDSLPPPVSDKVYTFAEIQEEKAALKDKIVRIEILYLLGEPSDLLGNGTLRFICKDTSKGATPYGQVAFPREGLEKMDLAQDPHRKGHSSSTRRCMLLLKRKQQQFASRSEPMLLSRTAKPPIPGKLVPSL